MEIPKTVVKPKLIGWVVLVQSLPITFRMTIFASSMGGTIAFLLTLLRFANFSLWWPFVYCGLAAFVAVPTIIYFIYHRTYEATAYKFYDEHLEYSEGFWTIENRTIAYRHITQIDLRRNVIQRIYGLGSVYLSVPSGVIRSGKFSGIVINNIENPELIYKKIQTILRLI